VHQAAVADVAPDERPDGRVVATPNDEVSFPVAWPVANKGLERAPGDGQAGGGETDPAGIGSAPASPHRSPGAACGLTPAQRPSPPVYMRPGVIGLTLTGQAR
jgi:hypothetical protein